MESKFETLAGGTRVFVDEHCTFGADALLLASFCNAKRFESVCDFGTGCGIIPLQLHDNGHLGTCYAIDINENALALLCKSIFNDSKLLHIAPQLADLRSWKAERPLDVITCNPPYFTGGIQNKDASRAVARHALLCTSEDVCRAAARSLKVGGRLCLCQRPAQLAVVLAEMRAARLEPKRLQFVSAREGKTPFLFLVEAQKGRAAGLRLLPTLIIQTADEQDSHAVQKTDTSIETQKGDL